MSRSSCGRVVGILKAPIRRFSATSSRFYSALAPCPTPTDSTREPETITLPGQRTLSFATFGARDGYPVFYLHGYPGSRLEAAVVGEDAAQLGAKIISVDRPGIGHSTPRHGRTPTDHARDVEALASKLGLDQYKILAVSGGGPYALACARFHSERLRAVALLAGMVKLPGVGYRGMRISKQAMFYAFRMVPSLFHTLVHNSATEQLKLTDDAWIEKSQKQLNSSWARPSALDQEVLADVSLLRRMFPSVREHFRQGIHGAMEELRILTTLLEFDVDEIVRPSISLWYGKYDTEVPPAIGEALHNRLRATSRLIILDETHLSMFAKRQKLVLQDLLDQT